MHDRLDILFRFLAVTDVDVPKGLFRWGTTDELSVLATWHSFGLTYSSSAWFTATSLVSLGYPNNPGSTFTNPGGLSLDDLLIVPQLGIGLAFAFRTDNQGESRIESIFNGDRVTRSGPPMSVAEVRQNHEILRQSYPGARIISSSFQNFLEDISGIESELQLFDRDISDSWLQGIGSDPKRVQQYQALQRALGTCFDRQLCNTDDEQLINASRFLIKIPGIHSTIRETMFSFSLIRTYVGFTIDLR